MLKLINLCTFTRPATLILSLADQLKAACLLCKAKRIDPQLTLEGIHITRCYSLLISDLFNHLTLSIKFVTVDNYGLVGHDRWHIEG